ncbi:MAG: AraC family transcriptional regulator [Gordonia sp. (in: high G+C Gram-positive bacteria)]
MAFSFGIETGDDWSDACGQCLLPMTVRHATPNFQATVNAAVLPGNLSVTRTSAQATHLGRTERGIRSEPREHLTLSFHRMGSGDIYQSGRRASLAPGAGIFYSSEQPAEFVRPTAYVSTGFTVERKALNLSDAEMNSIVARRFDIASSPGLRILSRMADELMDADPSSAAPAEWDALSHAAIVLLRGVAEAVSSRTEAQLPRNLEESRLATRQAALSYMERHFTDPELDTEIVAAHLHISRRHLYQVFEGTGVTPRTQLRELRLTYAERLLRRGCTVDAASRRSGFPTTDSFRRAFKEKNGMSPSQFLAAERSTR